jgi:hypothetical protein
MAPGEPPHFVTLGMFIIDEFSYMDGNGHPTGKTLPPQERQCAQEFQASESLTLSFVCLDWWWRDVCCDRSLYMVRELFFCASSGWFEWPMQLGSRRTRSEWWLTEGTTSHHPSKPNYKNMAHRCGCIGTNPTTLLLVRSTLTGVITEGTISSWLRSIYLVVYWGNLDFSFEYITPKIRITIRDLKDTRLARPTTLHFICSPSRAATVLSEIKDIDGWFPITIYEPIPVCASSQVRRGLWLFWEGQLHPRGAPGLDESLAVGVSVEVRCHIIWNGTNDQPDSKLAQTPKKRHVSCHYHALPRKTLLSKQPVYSWIWESERLGKVAS